MKRRGDDLSFWKKNHTPRPSLFQKFDPRGKFHAFVLFTLEHPYCLKGGTVLVLNQMGVADSGRTFCHTPGVLTSSDLPAIDFNHHITTHHSQRHLLLQGQRTGHYWQPVSSQPHIFSLSWTEGGNEFSGC